MKAIPRLDFSLSRHLTHLAVGLAVAGFATSPLAVAASDPPPPPLTGEFFLGAPTVTATCNPTGTSTISYSVSGTAFGPYPGTFTETGTATIGPNIAGQFVNGLEAGFLTSFDAFFTIDSPTGQVTGTKQLELPSTVFGFCYDLGPGVFLHELSPSPTGFGLHYDATIQSAGAFFGDSGDAGITLVECDGLPVCSPATDVFNEAFRSSNTTVVPLPTTTGQVTGGGQIPADTTFGLTAKSNQNGMKGECTVIDRARDTNVKCTDVTAFFEDGKSATFFGDALVNGASTSYRIDVRDNAEPGAGADTFAIHTGTGYSASGTLTQGNIQVH